MGLLKTIIITLLNFFVMQAQSQLLKDSLLSGSNELVFASDTQAPIWLESIWLRPSHNRSATKSIFADMVIRQPKSVFILGDVVSLGTSNRQWRKMDVYLENLKEKGVSVNAALGNHEVMGQPVKGERKFQKRFPNHVNTGYVEVVDSVAVILLNSNFGTLSQKQDAFQQEWYKNKLDTLDADSSIQFIITGCHHSPYTNSKIVGSSIAVRQKFVTHFLKSPKSRLFLSGHSHNFEHFRVYGKDFLVIGGGGGLHQPLRASSEATSDIASSYKPMFHYLSVRRFPDHLDVTSVRLKSDRSGFEEGLKIEVFKDKQSVTVPILDDAKKNSSADSRF
jgi:hypothetical protein